jgi:predicted PurR-regulated permease PerM
MTIIIGENREDLDGQRGQPGQPGRLSGDLPSSPWSVVPWRAIVAGVVIVGTTLIFAFAVMATFRVLVWASIAGFFAIVLAPGVRKVQSVMKGHRGIATAIVMFSVTATLFAMLAIFVMPIRTQIIRTVTDLPGTVDAAAKGTGPLGDIVVRLRLDRLVSEHRVELKDWAAKMNDSSFTVARSAFDGVLAFLTVFVICFLLLTQSSAIGRALLGVIPKRRQASAKRVSVEAASAVSGYMIGNLLISLVAGLSAFGCLLILRVPNPAVFGLWVAFADLIPLVGATLGAIPAVLASFLHTPTTGFIALVFFIVYQQFENSVLQTAVMSRTVKVNPLVVLLSVLLGVELFGFVGAIFAIPLAGSMQVFATEIVGESRRDHLLLP